MKLSLNHKSPKEQEKREFRITENLLLQAALYSARKPLTGTIYFEIDLREPLCHSVLSIRSHDCEMRKDQN